MLYIQYIEVQGYTEGLLNHNELSLNMFLKFESEIIFDINALRAENTNEVVMYALVLI